MARRECKPDVGNGVKHVHLVLLKNAGAPARARLGPDPLVAREKGNGVSPEWRLLKWQSVRLCPRNFPISGGFGAQFRGRRDAVW